MFIVTELNLRFLAHSTFDVSIIPKTVKKLTIDAHYQSKIVGRNKLLVEDLCARIEKT